MKLGGKTTVSGGSGGSESTTSADNSVAGTTLDGSVGEEDTDNTDQQLATIRAPAACKGLFRCFVCKNANSERLPAARLLNHLRYFHGPELIEVRLMTRKMKQMIWRKVAQGQVQV